MSRFTVDAERRDPRRVAGRFGVVIHEGGRSWQIAEIVGPTGLWIDYGAYPDVGDAEAECRRLDSLEKPTDG